MDASPKFHPAKCGRVQLFRQPESPTTNQDLDEGASTRLLVYCAALIRSGIPPDMAVHAALIEPLSDDDEIKSGLEDIARAVMG